nr:MAG TPA: hypothetical protein [Bacteriophage sp.]
MTYTCFVKCLCQALRTNLHLFILCALSPLSVSPDCHRD